MIWELFQLAQLTWIQNWMVRISFSSACKFVKGSRRGREAAEEHKRPQRGRQKGRTAAVSEAAQRPRANEQRPRSGLCEWAAAQR